MAAANFRMKRFAIGRDGFNFNEGGRFLTAFWSRKLRLARVWFKPIFWKPGSFELEFVWYGRPQSVD